MDEITRKSAPAYVRTLAYIFLFLVLIIPSPAFCEDSNNEVNLDADKVTYAENTGIATADGNVKISNRDMRLFAPYVEYNSNNQVIEAFSDTRNNVTLMSGTSKLIGKHLTYNLYERRGVLTQASGKMDAFYIKGSDVRVMPMEDALKQGIIARNSKKNKNLQDDSVAEWLDVTTTTCDFEKPHYKFVSKKVIVVPGKKVIIKNPEIYIGESRIFKYPFDYVLNLDSSNNDQSILPFFDYDSDKGIGGGLKGIIDIGNFGELDIAGIYWSKEIFEARLRYQKEILDDLFIFAETDRFYNEDDDEIMWRPKWGVEYSKPDGWEFSIYESQRELIKTEMRSGQEKRYNVWRSPEIKFYSPWYGDMAHGGRFRLFGIYGRYQDNLEMNDPWIHRLALGAEMNGTPDVGASLVQPYYGARYVHFDYESGETTQKVTDGWIGFKWSIGEVNLDSYYFRRWVEGSTLLEWDKYEEREDFYQTISFPLPFGASWEKWTLSVRAGYDNISSELAEIVYMLNYNKHCMTWQLWAKDERADDNNLSMGLTFYINAYPGATLGAGPYERDIYIDQQMGTIDMPDSKIR